MTKPKMLYIVLILIFGGLIFVVSTKLYEDSKPLKERIDATLADYDSNYSKTITIQFHKNKLYAFYETNNHILRVVLFKNNAIKGIYVDKTISEYLQPPINPESKVIWQGTGNHLSDTFLLYGIIFDPNITQLFLESENNKTAHLYKGDGDRTIWFKFLDESIKTPVTISGVDKKGKELFYFGPDESRVKEAS